MLETLIPSKIRLALLRTLYLAPQSEQDYPRALARRLHLPYMPVQKELASLYRAGIVTRRLFGRQQLYVVNPSWPLYEPLHMLLQREQASGESAGALPKPVAEVVAVLKREIPPSSRVFLFGSRARGDARANSDWDIGFESANGLPLTQLLRLKAIIRERAWPYRVDVVDMRRVTPQFRDLAMRHHINI